MLGKFVTWVIRGYQVGISPFWGARCRFYPSCSSYSVEAIEKYGLGRGLLLSVWRVCRCHPWARGGYDPVE